MYLTKRDAIQVPTYVHTYDTVVWMQCQQREGTARATGGRGAGKRNGAPLSHKNREIFIWGIETIGLDPAQELRTWNPLNALKFFLNN